MSSAPANNGNGAIARIEALEKGFTAFSEKLDSIEKAVTTFTASRGTFNFQSIGIVIAIGTVIWAAIRLQFQADLSQVVSEQTRSQSERSENRRSLEKLSDDMHSKFSKSDEFASISRSKVEGADYKLRELEDQIDKERKIRNIDKANHIREFSPIYEKVTGMRYPSEVQYYPETIAPDYRQK